MTHQWLAFAAVTALAAAASPAIAQDRAPAPPAWADPQGAPYPPPPPRPAGPEGYAPHHDHPLPPGVYPEARGPDSYRPMIWHGEGSSAYDVDGGYWYAYQTGGAPCGCPSYTWMPVPIETRYRYSAPLRHVEETVESRVVRERVVERKIVPVKRSTKYLKATPAKVAKVRVTK